MWDGNDVGCFLVMFVTVGLVAGFATASLIDFEWLLDYHTLVGVSIGATVVGVLAFLRG